MVHHVISQFVDRNWELREQVDRARYLALLGRAIADSDWLCLAWALMSSHIHLALLAGRASLSSWARRVNPPFALWMNEKYGRLGPLFAGRPKMWVIESHDEPRLLAYIHNNPVRAGVARRASESEWTSHRAYVGLSPAPPWLALREGIARSGCQDAVGFDAWVDANAGVRRNDPELIDMHRAAKKRGGLELGTPTVEPLSVPIVARPFAHVRIDPRMVVEAIADTLNVPVNRVCSRSTQRELVAARRIAAHIGRACGLTNSTVAAALGVSAQSASKLALTKLDEEETVLLSRAQRRLLAGSCESGKRP